VTFQSVSVSGGTTGILLNTTGAGPFSVTGVGTTAGSGGTIANTSARGASFTSASNVTLKNMNFTSATTATAGTCVANVASGSNATCNAPIHLASVTTATLDRLVVSGSAQMGINANAVSGLTLTNSTISSIGSSAAGEHTAVLLQNMSGTSSVTGNTITNNDFGHNVFVTSNTGSMTLNFRANTVSTTSGTPANSDGFQAQGYNAAAMTIAIDNTGGTCSFDRLWANGVEIGANDTSTVTATLSGCSVSRTNGILMDGNGSSVLTATITNNQIRNKSIALDGFGNGSNGITATKVAGSTGRVAATITGNHIQRANCGGGCYGIAATNQGGGGTASTFVIRNNTVENVDEVGIRFVTGGGSPNSVLTLEGNNITNPNDANGYAIDIFHGTNLGDTPCLAADIGTMNGGTANTISNGSTGFQWVNIAGVPTIGPVKNQGGSFRLFGYGGASDAAAAAYIVSHNPGTSSDAAGGFSGGTNCP
jgi:hypothetical protein